MNKQKTFTDMEYAQRKLTGRREEFLDTMDAITPRAAFEETIKPFYPKSGLRGRQPKGIELMLRMYFPQVWFNSADESLEENIYGSCAMRKFMRLDYSREDVPDAAALLHFRHLLEKHKLQKELFETLKGLTDAKVKIMHGGTIVDATIIEAPSSTKNSAKSRDPEMKSTQKGSQWHFGMKAHIGVDAGTGMVHSLEVTGANVCDLDAAAKLIRPDDEVVNGEAGYVGIEEREEIKNDEHLSKIEYRINKRKGADKKRRDALLSKPMAHLDYIAQPAWDKHIEYMKSKVRCKVEHAFAIIKNKIGYRKAVYRGLAKNKARLYMLFCGANLLRLSWSLA
jgi:IS5 family transposase